jgi:hypothetical protein
MKNSDLMVSRSFFAMIDRDKMNYTEYTPHAPARTRAESGDAFGPIDGFPWVEAYYWNSEGNV